MPLGASRLSLLALPQVEATPAGRPWAITAYGDAQVDTAYSQFGGSSLYLDGTGDYIEVENDFLFGTTDNFTIEFWYKKHTTNTTEQIASNRGAYSTGHWYIQFDHTTDKIQWGVNGAAAQRSTNTFDDTNWHHFALVRDGGNFELFIDGSSEGTLTGPYTWGRAGEYYKFGQVATSHGNLSIDEIRISDSARYTTGFTPFPVAFGNDANTLLLVHCDGADGSTTFTDDNVTPIRQALVGIAVNGCELQTAQKKFGTTSAHFDGSNDYFYVPGNTQNVDFSGDFTLEAWIRKDHTVNNTKIFDLRGIQSSHTGGDTLFNLSASLLVDFNGDDFRVFIDGGNRSTGSNVLSANTWYHIAVQRSGGTFNAWFNGTRYVNYASSDDFTTVFAANHAVGMGASTSVLSQPWPGYMDEIRWSTVARYTNGASITTPTSAFTNDANTYLLLHLDGTNGSTTFTDDNS